MSSLGFFSVFFLPYSHIYRKEMFVYCFLCHFIQGFIWWDFIMNFIHNDFFRDRIGLSNFRLNVFLCAT